MSLPVLFATFNSSQFVFSNYDIALSQPSLSSTAKGGAVSCTSLDSTTLGIDPVSYPNNCGFLIFRTD